MTCFDILRSLNWIVDQFDYYNRQAPKAYQGENNILKHSLSRVKMAIIIDNSEASDPFMNPNYLWDFFFAELSDAV